MTLNDKARNLLLKSYKDIKDKDKFIHSMLTGMLLESYGYKENIISAGYLLNIKDISNLTYEDISKLFGGDVTSLLLTSKGADKSLDVITKQKQELKALDNLPIPNMILVLASKIAYLEYLIITNNYDDNTLAQKEYYKNIYNKAKEVYDGPLLERFESLIDNYFSKEHDEIKNIYLDYYSNREELIKLKAVVSESNPYIVSLSFKEEKSNLKELIKSILNDENYLIKVLDDNNNNKYVNKVISGDGINKTERNLLLSSALKNDLVGQIISDKKVFLISEGLYDSLIYLKMLISKGLINIDVLDNYLNFYITDLEYLINYANVNYSYNEDYYDSEEAINNIEDILGSSSGIDKKQEVIIVAGTLLPMLDDIKVLKKIVEKV